MDSIWYYFKNNEIYVQRHNIILKNCTASGTNKIAHNSFDSDLLHVMNIAKLNFIKLIFPLNKQTKKINI